MYQFSYAEVLDETPKGARERERQAIDRSIELLREAEAQGVRSRAAIEAILFRAARFVDGKILEQPTVSMYFNGKKVHTNVEIQKVWGGPNSGVDGGNDNGFGITDTPQGLKLQCEGHDVRYRNTWIKELDLAKPTTDF